MKKLDFIETKGLARGVLSTLRKVRKLLSNPKRWIQGSNTEELADGTTGYCLLGATEKVDGPFEQAVVQSMAEFISDGYIASFNDAPRRKHSQILKFLDKVIGKVEARKAAL